MHAQVLEKQKRSAEELFDIRSDAGCLKNLANEAGFAKVKSELSAKLNEYLSKTGDARVVAKDGGDVWETYPRYSGLRWFPTPGWAKETPSLVPKQDWLEERRPK